MPRGRPKKTVAEKTAYQKPKLYTRGESGLLDNVDYVWNDDGSVNWRAMIKEEHLFPNKSWFESRGKDMPRSTEGLEDHQLLIKLGGIKELARLRGFTSCKYELIKCEADHVAAICTMSFIPNYETHGQEVLFQDAANATTQNTSSFATKFLETIACNRAFVRCVRNFLNIHIVGDDEIDKSNIPAQLSSSLAPLTPNALLEKEFSDFEGFKTKLRTLWANKSYQNADAAKWKVFKDIPPKEARLLIKLVKQ